VLLRELLGDPGVDIGVRPDRAPALPAGWVGSLAHDLEVAVAAVAPASAGVAAVGVDVEAAGPMETAEAAIVLRDDEDGLDPRLAFTLKEAAYKAWSGLGGRLLDHHDVRLGLEGTAFVATVVGEGRVLAGRYAAAGGRWLALTVVSR
jgi:4'-phosphopantetheinyl transferase EntD